MISRKRLKLKAKQLVRPHKPIRNLLALCTGSFALTTFAEPSWQHLPHQPKQNQPVVITVQTKGPPFDSRQFLHFQTVDPGNYVAESDLNYLTSWKFLPMNDQGEGGDQTANDGIFSVTIDAEVQRHRRLVRYVITSSPILSERHSRPGSTAGYFVYNGVPDWSAAINPSSPENSLAQTRLYPAEALTRVPVYHLITKNEWIEDATWPRNGRSSSRRDNQYRYTGTLVYNGDVYDHVQFRARGGVWRHAMGKNMWKVNFRKEQPFAARDQYGTPYPAPWDKLNLGACIQQGQYGMRGEHGMFEALSYRLFNLAGVPAPHTHWIHFRVIDDEAEFTSSQYDGDFWGLYLAVENIDESFLRNHALPEGNLYKIENLRPHERYHPIFTPRTNPNRFIQSISRKRNAPTWWQEHVDLASYYSYRSIVEFTHHYDIAHGKNYYFYFDGGQSRWLTVPWDVDLTWATHMFGSGSDPIYRSGILRHREFNSAYLQRLAELQDLLFSSESINRLIDDYASVIDPPEDDLSLADADRAMWDFHPMLDSNRVMRHQAGQGRYYFGNPYGHFRDLVAYLKNYAVKRSKWIEGTLLRHYTPPPPPELESEHVGQEIAVRAHSQHPEPIHFEWRLGRISSPAFAGGLRGSYEVEGAILEKVTGDTLEIDTSQISIGSYRIRARRVLPSGEKSRWSDAFDFRADN